MKASSISVIGSLYISSLLSITSLVDSSPVFISDILLNLFLISPSIVLSIPYTLPINSKRASIILVNILLESETVVEA